MKNLILIVSFFCCLSLSVNAQKGSVKSGKIYSRILGVDKEYSVYLPDGYETSGYKYPVLYLLHGAWGNHTNWLNAGNLAFVADKTIKEGFASQMVIVMPDARGKEDNFGGHHMGYFNYPDWKYQEFFILEFLPAIEKEYRIKSDKQHRAIAGLSMGGGGSIILAQKYPDYFGSACSLSGALIASDEIPSRDVDADFLREMKNDDPTAFLHNADKETLSKLNSVRWYVDCGDKDFLSKGNVLYFLAMKERGVSLEYRMRGGAHTWNYWQSGLVPVLQYISVGFMGGNK